MHHAWLVKSFGVFRPPKRFPDRRPKDIHVVGGWLQGPVSRILGKLNEGYICCIFLKILAAHTPAPTFASFNCRRQSNARLTATRLGPKMWSVACVPQCSPTSVDVQPGHAQGMVVVEEVPLTLIVGVGEDGSPFMPRGASFVRLSGDYARLVRKGIVP